MEFDSVTLLLYIRRDDAPNHTDEELAEIQSGHLAHLRAMGAAGHAYTAGPFDNQSDDSFRGLVFFSVSPAEALQLTEGDPAVQAQRLRAEAMTWYFEKGTALFPATS